MYTKQLNYALSKLGSCPAVHVYKLEWSRASCNDLPMLLDCTPGLAQCLVASFPGLTALSLDGYSVTCSGLASLLSHPQLALQLRQLDLTRTTISQPKRPEPGAVTLDTLFCGVRLKQLSVEAEYPPLPNLQPLAQHLTQLSIGWPEQSPQPQQTITSIVTKLSQLTQLQVPAVSVCKQQPFDELLAATQLTSVQLGAIFHLTSSRANAPCSWQQLEVAGLSIGAAAYLPLHSLTRPLTVGRLCINDRDVSSPKVAEGVQNLSHSCTVSVIIKTLGLHYPPSLQAEAVGERAVRQRRDMEKMMVILRPVQRWRVEEVAVLGLLDVSSKDVQVLAPVCQGCSRLEIRYGSVIPSLEFWRQLVLLMPSVTQVTISYTQGAATVAMHESLRHMAEQPWARWLDITIVHASSKLAPCWRINTLSSTGKFKVCIK
ncbi:hypothetical protein V8C86DRAFT_56392 [Haematococcus lacustris]